MATYGMKDACNLTLVKRGTNEVVLHSDYANTTNVEWKSDRVYAKLGYKRLSYHMLPYYLHLIRLII